MSWTSIRLRSSIRIFPDFNQNRHSSLPFGSYHCNFQISLGSWVSAIHLAAIIISLVRVQYGSEFLSLRPGTFTISLSIWNFFNFRSRYFFAIGVYLYLALEVSTSLSHCTTKQHYSLLFSGAGTLTHSGPAFHQVYRQTHYNCDLSLYHLSSFMFIRHY